MSRAVSFFLSVYECNDKGGFVHICKGEFSECFEPSTCSRFRVLLT